GISQERVGQESMMWGILSFGKLNKAEEELKLLGLKEEKPITPTLARGAGSSGWITITVNGGPWITVDHQTGNFAVTVNAGGSENKELDILPIVLATDLNNDGQITSADSALREAATEPGAS